jgi:hypothetical protein
MAMGDMWIVLRKRDAIGIVPIASANIRESGWRGQVFLMIGGGVTAWKLSDRRDYKTYLMATSELIVTEEIVVSKIFYIREYRVMLDKIPGAFYVPTY